jgi:uncharacterized membrane protein
MTTFFDFWLSVLASIVAAILVAIAAKITLEKWKRLAIGFGATAFVALIVSVIIFAYGGPGFLGHENEVNIVFKEVVNGKR